MDLLVAQLLNGLVYGVLLFLMAAGLSLIFGLMNVVSLAHGSFFMLGAYLGLSIFRATGSFWLALVLAPIPVVAIGVAIERLFLRPLYRRGHMDQVLLTFGFTFVFLDLVQTVWGRSVQRLPVPEALQGTMHIGAGVFSAYRLFLIGFGVAIALLLWLFLERSRIGAMVRAGVDDAQMAAGLGGNIPALFSGMFGFGVALAALGGVAAGPILSLYPGMDAEILIPAFIVIVIGGLGSLRGAFVGSLLIGIADTFGKAYLPSLALFLIYLAMILVLLIRPQGLFGIKYSDVSIPSAVSITAVPTTNRTRIAGLVALLALLVLPFAVSDYSRALVAEIFIFAIFAMSLDLLLGFTGLMSLGHAAFFGLGAYAVAVSGTMFGIDAWIGLTVGIALAALAAGVIGWFCVRTGGVTFLMLTLAFSQLVFTIALKWRDVTGGSDGLAIAEKPSFFGFDLSNSLVMYYMALAFFVLIFSGLRRLINAPLGRVFVGIRENEQRMMAVGYPTRTYKLLSFTISAAIAGLAGGLYAIFNGFISADALYWTASGDVLIMTMLGGAGTLIGPAIGAGVFLLMKNVVSSYNEHWLAIIGITFICCVMFFPAGIWGALRDIRMKRARP
jgi:branched-chain amino acid transport system permease protein